MTCLETETLNRIQNHLNHIKVVFLDPDYDDYLQGYIVEDHIHAIEDVINAYRTYSSGSESM